MENKIYVIHENDDWTRHLTRRLDELSLPYETWHLDSGHFDLSAAAPAGVYYNRMSASSHTRGHRYAPELTGAVLDWLEFYDRRLLNGSSALRLELSKVKQYTALERAGIKTPKTAFAVGKEQIIAAARKLGVTPFITKHNRAGKGLGVHLFDSVDALADYVHSPQFDDSVDGITLVQEYIDSPGGFITRSEFVGGKYLYTVKVRTDSSFQLCPADNCQIEFTSCPAGYDDEAKSRLTMPIMAAPIAAINIDSTSFGTDIPSLEITETAEPMKFEIIDTADSGSGYRRDVIAKYEKFLSDNNVEVAGIESIEDANGNIFTYDVNTNTNYNPDAEAKAGKFAMLELAKYLSRQLESLSEADARPNRG